MGIFIVIVFLVSTALQVYIDFQLLNVADRVAKMVQPYGITPTFNNTLILWDLRVNLILLIIVLILGIVIVVINLKQGLRKDVDTCRKAVHWKNS